MKYFILTTIFLYFLTSTYSKSITGRVINNENLSPIEFVSITLQKSDSTFVSGTQSDTNGYFKIEGDFSQQDYFIKASFIGCNTTFVRINNLEENIDVGDIRLTTNFVLLDEISVAAKKTIYKVDRQIILPSKMEIESSSNGFDLLAKISIPGLLIEPINRSIKYRNEDVQLRINGIKVNLQDLIALRPEDISRVEYFDEPGARFGSDNVTAVINYITKRSKNMGGYIALEGRNAPFIEFGDDQLSVKANHKASQFSFDYAISYRGYNKRWSEGKGAYHFPEKSISYIEKGIEMPMSYQVHNINLTYNLAKSDKYTFNASVKDEITNVNSTYGHNILYTNNNQKNYAYSKNKPLTNNPVLDLYFQQELKNKQSLTLNVVGTYIKTDQKNWYEEISKNSIDKLSIYNEVNGQKYSIIGELLYNKELEKNMALSVGGKHTQGYAENKYRGNTISDNTMQNSESYIYGQLQGKIKERLSYLIGIGGSRIWYKEAAFDQTYYLIRPSVQVSYPINDNINLRYSFNINTTTPSLGILTDVEQRVDSFRVTKGNPNIKPYNTYTNRITASFEKEHLSLQLNISHDYMHKPFMKTYAIEDNYILSYSENYKSFQKFGADIAAFYTIIKDVWTMNVFICSYRFISNNEYQSFNYTSLFGNLQSNLLYRNFSLLVGMQSRYNTLWGQSINYGEKWSNVEAGYKYKEAKLAMGISLPFDKYWSAGSKNLSTIMPYESWSYIKECSRMVYLSFSWNISFGRKYKAQVKELNNTDNDTGIL